MADDEIAVRLNLLSGQDTQAAADLAKALGDIAKMFEAIRSQDYLRQAEKFVQLSRQMTEDMQRSGRPTPYSSTAPAATGTADESNADTERRRLYEAQQQHRETARQEAEQRAKDERARLRGGMDANAANWDRQLEAMDMPSRPRKDTVNIPQFGALTLQDYLREGSEFFERRAVKQFEKGEDPARSIGLRNRLDDRYADVGYVYAARDAIKRTNAHLQNQGIDIPGVDMTGGSMGYDRGTIGPVFNPFSEAGGEGWRQQMTMQGLRLRGGINARQAQGIVQATSGFGDQRGRSIAEDVMAPFVQRTGVDPNAIAPFLQTLRTGTQDMDDLKETIDQLGSAARAASMTVEETAAAINQVGEATQAAGGYREAGLQFGTQFQTSTGLPATVGQQLLSDPLVQANLAGMTGVAPAWQANLSAGQKQQAIQMTARQRVEMYTAGIGPEGVTDQITLADGRVLGEQRTSREELGMGAAAQSMGMSSDELDKLMRGEDLATRASEALQGAQAYMDAEQEASRGAREQAAEEIAARFPRAAGDIDEAGNVKGGEGHNRFRADSDAQRLQRRIDERAAQITKERLGRNPGEIEWKELKQLGEQAGLTPEEIEEIEGKKGRKKRATAMQKAIGEKTEAMNNPRMHVELTGPAKKLFKVMIEERGEKFADWYKDDSSSNTNTPASTSRGPAPLGPRPNIGFDAYDG